MNGMNGPAVLERRYRWLLRCYPHSFRNENAEEVLGVLMTGAPDGKRWPSTMETADVLWSALRMRLRLPPAGSQTPGWSGAWAAFSVLAPVFLLVANLLVVEVRPHFLPVRSSAPWFKYNSTSWLPYFEDAHAFYILLIFQAAIVIAVLAGWRWVALAATVGSALSWGATLATYPEPATLLTGAVYILETAALLTSPGPRLGRTLLTRGHGAVLLLALAAVKLSSLTWWATIVPASQLIGNPKPLADLLLVVAAALAVAAVIGSALRHHGGHLGVLMAALLYPYAIEYAFLVFGHGSDADLLYSDITPLRLAILFLLPLVLTALAVLVAVRGRLAAASAGLTPGH